MSSNKLTLSLLMALSLLGLSACKEGGKNGRTTIRKGAQSGKPQPNGSAKTNSQNQNGPTSSQKRNDTTNGTNSDATTTTTTTSGKATDATQNGADAAGVKTTYASCATTLEEAKKNGWKADSVEVQDGNKKLKITYYTLEKSGSELSKPVVYFNKSAFQNIDAQDFSNFSEIYESHKVDPVLIDMRGAGCSSELPNIKTNLKDLQRYGSRYAVSDAEAVRKKLLNNKKWQILAHRSGGAVALRYVHLAPNGIAGSIHIADFAPVRNQSQLMKLRLAQEESNWMALKKEQKLEDSDIEKALKNLEAEKCSGLTSCKALIDLLAWNLGDKTQWQGIANQFKRLAQGSMKASDLQAILEARKSRSEINTVARILDLDSDKSLTACKEAIKTENKATLNSCRAEALIGIAQHDAIKTTLQHDPLDMVSIKKNLSEHKITYHLFSGKLSTTYPHEAYQEHHEEMGDHLHLTLKEEDDLGSEIFKLSEFLDTLRE